MQNSRFLTRYSVIGTKRIVSMASLIANLRAANIWRAGSRLPTSPACHGRKVGKSRESIWPTLRSDEHTSELQSLMRTTYSVFCLKKHKQSHLNLTCL